MSRRLLATIAVLLATLSVAAGLADPVERFTPGQLFVAGGNAGVFAFDADGVSVPSSLTGLRPLTGLTPLSGLSSVHDLTFGPQGTLYVTDNDLDRVFVYEAAGQAPVAEFSAPDLERPTDLAFGPRGRLYVASSAQDLVLVFRRDGSVVDSVGPGTGLVDPRGITFGNDGHLFVSSHGTDRVLEIDGSGALLGAYGAGTALAGPYGLAFGRSGLLHVASMDGNEVLQFDPSGSVVGSLGAGSLVEPTALAFGPDGNLYVASRGSDRVLVFDDAGDLLAEIGADTALSGPTGLAFAPFLSSARIKGVLSRPDGSDQRLGTRATIAWSPGSGRATLLVDPSDPLAEVFGSDVMTFTGRSTRWEQGGAFVGTEIPGPARSSSWGAVGLEFHRPSEQDGFRRLSGSLNTGGPEGGVQARLKGRRQP